ncbi:hypothetical protein KM043_004621 [Ampulex compressa]|nr:hypothetical protein KM043_004621 [Ampulex compressa]
MGIILRESAYSSLVLHASSIGPIVHNPVDSQSQVLLNGVRKDFKPRGGLRCRLSFQNNHLRGTSSIDVGTAAGTGGCTLKNRALVDYESYREDVRDNEGIFEHPNGAH